MNDKPFFPEYPAKGEEKMFTVGPIDYPDTWQTTPLPESAPSGDEVFPRLERTYIDCRVVNGICGDSGDAEAQLYCFSCTFRPWVDTGEVASATVTIERADGTTEQAGATLTDGRWRTSTRIYEGDTAFVDRAGIVDTFGEINGAPSAIVAGTRRRPPNAEGIEHSDGRARGEPPDHAGPSNAV